MHIKSITCWKQAYECDEFTTTYALLVIASSLILRTFAIYRYQ